MTTDRILRVSDVAELLGCEPETVRQRTPHTLPGVKFGRDWVYVESQIIEAVKTLAKAPAKPQRRSVEPSLPVVTDGRRKPLPQLRGEV